MAVRVKVDYKGLFWRTTQLLARKAAQQTAGRWADCLLAQRASYPPCGMRKVLLPLVLSLSKGFWVQDGPVQRGLWPAARPRRFWFVPLCADVLRFSGAVVRHPCH